MQVTYFETDPKDLDKSTANSLRAALGIGGLLSLVIGLVILIWPDKSAMFLAGLIALYAGIAGLVNLGVGIFSRKLGGWPRVGHLVLGVIFLVAAGLAFGNLNTAAQVLFGLLGIIVGVVWIIQGVVGFTMVGDAASKAWTIIMSILSILAGLVLVTSPLWGIAILAWLLAFSLVILGIVQIVRAFRFGSK